MGIEAPRTSERDEVRKVFTAFLAFVVLYSALGIPAYLYFRRDRAEAVAADAERLREKERAEREQERIRGLEEAVRTRPAAPAGIHGPNGVAPSRGAAEGAAPPSAVDYLPPEQRRMLQPGGRRPR